VTACWCCHHLPVCTALALPAQPAQEAGGWGCWGWGVGGGLMGQAGLCCGLLAPKSASVGGAPQWRQGCGCSAQESALSERAGGRAQARRPRAATPCGGGWRLQRRCGESAHLGRAIGVLHVCRAEAGLRGGLGRARGLGFGARVELSELGVPASTGRGAVVLQTRAGRTNE
jgi:hypothetical protein